jgi:putative hydrolase of the HAD superfamily
MSGWRAVVFDLDDTLFPERDYVLSGFRAVAAWAELHLGIDARTGYTELEALFAQGIRDTTFNRWLALHGLPADGLIPGLVQVYREHEPRLVPFPEARPVLERLRTTYRLGLLADGYLAVQQRKLRALGLASYFDGIVFSDELGRDAWKPSERPFQIVLARLAVSGPEALYVADNPLKDFVGARRCGMATVWVHRPDGEYSHLQPATPDHAPDYTIASLVALNEHLLDWSRERASKRGPNPHVGARPRRS